MYVVVFTVLKVNVVRLWRRFLYFAFSVPLHSAKLATGDNFSAHRHDRLFPSSYVRFTDLWTRWGTDHYNYGLGALYPLPSKVKGLGKKAVAKAFATACR